MAAVSAAVSGGGGGAAAAVVVVAASAECRRGRQQQRPVQRSVYNSVATRTFLQESRAQCSPIMAQKLGRGRPGRSNFSTTEASIQCACCMGVECRELGIRRSEWVGTTAAIIRRGAAAFDSASDETRRSSGMAVVARTGGGAGQGPPRPRISTPGRRGPAQPQDASSANDGPLMNNDIRVPTVRLLDEEQNMVGVISSAEALQRARDADLDLVMISPDADPPVVRIMDYSKYRYELQKKKREAQKKAAASRQELKELKMRYNIDTHDYAVRLRAAQRFLRDGDKVKVVCQFKGRELDFKDLAVKLFERFQEEIGELAIVETKITFEGKTMIMVLTPNKAAQQKAQALVQSVASKAKTQAGEKSETAASV